MFKTLAALALSMLAGAYLLTSIEPGPAFSSIHPGVLLHAQGKHAQDRSNQHKDLWQQALVICALDAKHNALSGIGINTLEDAHLTIDPDGQLLINDAWASRQQLEGLKNTLVICLEMMPTDTDISSEQLETLDLLVSRMRRELGLSAKQIRFESLHPNIPNLSLYLARSQGPESALTLNN